MPHGGDHTRQAQRLKQEGRGLLQDVAAGKRGAREGPLAALKALQAAETQLQASARGPSARGPARQAGTPFIGTPTRTSLSASMAGAAGRSAGAQGLFRSPFKEAFQRRPKRFRDQAIARRRPTRGGLLQTLTGLF